jgi:hypothetical protein
MAVLLRWRLGLLCFVFLALRLLGLSQRPNSILINSIPDDAFYYLQIAATRATEGRFSFDGISTTSGFHLLFGYVLAAFYAVAPTISFRAIWLLTSLGACVLFAIAAQQLSEALRDDLASPRTRVITETAVFLAFAAPIGAMLSTCLMEGVLALPVIACTYATLLESRRRVRALWLYLLLGAAGVFARTDYIVLPAAWVAVAVILYGGRHHRAILPPLFCLLGSIVAECATLLHNLVLTGHATQMSAAIKFHWSQVAGHSFVPGMMTLARTLLPAGLFELGGRWTLIVGISVLFLLGARTAFQHRATAPSEWRARLQVTLRNRASIDGRAIATLVVPFVLLGYMLAYRQNSAAMQLWYGVNFIVPLAVILTVLGTAIDARLGGWSTAVLFGVYTVSAVGGLIWQPWKNGTENYVAALALRDLPITAPIGAWNAGTLKYFSRRNVINLDGLIDDEAARDVLTDCLICFVKKHRIAYIADNETMFDAETARRGGYGDGRLRECLSPVRHIDEDIVSDPRRRWASGRISLYRVDASCVDAVGAPTDSKGRS